MSDKNLILHEKTRGFLFTYENEQWLLGVPKEGAAHWIKVDLNDLINIGIVFDDVDKAKDGRTYYVSTHPLSFISTAD